MADDEKRTVTLRFEVGDARTMGFSNGADDFLPEEPWMSFSITPTKDYPDRQIIWMLSDNVKHSTSGSEQKTERDGQWRWILTEKTSGTLLLRSAKPGAPLKGDGSNVTWFPETSGLDYFSEESYSIDLLVPDHDFNDIRSLLAAGKPPSKVCVYTSDVEFDRAPSGNGREWHVGTTSFAKVTAFSIGLSVAAPHVFVGLKKTEIEIEDAAERDEQLRQAVLESRQDIQLLCHGLANTNALVNAVRRQSQIQIGVTLLLLGCLVLSYLR